MTYPLHIQRYVVALYGNHLSMREIRTRTGIPLGSVQVILKRYCQKLIRPKGDTRNNTTRLSSAERAAIIRQEDAAKEFRPRSKASPGTARAIPAQPPLRSKPEPHDRTNA